MRTIIFDTETTGMNKENVNKALGHRVVELGCVELIDRVPTGRYYHCYFNPEQSVDPEAVAVHGLTDDFLNDQPRFQDKIDEIEAYLANADELVAHNINFDRQFIDQELKLAQKKYKLSDRFTLIDSLKIAKEKFPGARNNLDALCKRFNIDNSNRDLHGALLDSELLAQVYLKLTGGQYEFSFAGGEEKAVSAFEEFKIHQYEWPRVTVSVEDEKKHAEIMESLQK